MESAIYGLQQNLLPLLVISLYRMCIIIVIHNSNTADTASEKIKTTVVLVHLSSVTRQVALGH